MGVHVRVVRSRFLVAAPLVAGVVLSLGAGGAAGGHTGKSRELVPPDTAIVFSRCAYDENDLCIGTIWVINTDGSNLHELINSGSGDSDPELSPDGTLLAFSSNRGGGHGSSIWVARPDGTGARQITRGGDDYMPAWSPSGSEIAFERAVKDWSDWELYIAEEDGSAVRRIPGGADFDGLPDWNPADGDLVIASWGSEGLGGKARCANNTAALYRLDSNGRRARRITRCSWVSLMPTWSPDGSAIAWSRGKTDDTLSLAVMNADTKNVRILEAGGEQAAWSPDGKWLAYIREGNIFLVRGDGAGRIQLTSRLGASEPTWAPSRIPPSTTEGFRAPMSITAWQLPVA